MEKIGLGGSCHWCTEAIFQSLLGVSNVFQGWISSSEFSEFSEAIIIDFDPQTISLDVLIEIHLHTHSCTSNHALRTKYRSAVYCYSDQQKSQSSDVLLRLQKNFESEIITEALMLKEFRLNKEEYLSYYYNDPTKAFCQNIINPKLRLLLDKFRGQVILSKLPFA